MADGPVSGVTGTRAVRRVQRNGERKGRRQYRRDDIEEDGKDNESRNPRSRKGRYLDERC